MPEIIFGILVLALFLWAGSAFATVDPRKLAPVVKFAGGFGALGGAEMAMIDSGVKIEPGSGVAAAQKYWRSHAASATAAAA